MMANTVANLALYFYHNSFVDTADFGEHTRYFAAFTKQHIQTAMTNFNLLLILHVMFLMACGRSPKLHGNMIHDGVAIVSLKEAN